MGAAINAATPVTDNSRAGRARTVLSPPGGATAAPLGQREETPLARRRRERGPQLRPGRGAGGWQPPPGFVAGLWRHRRATGPVRS